MSAVGQIFSTGLPAYASNNGYNPALANDSAYNTFWVDGNTPSVAAPSWWAVDISSVANATKQQCSLVWFNEGGQYWQDTTAYSATYYNLPSDYTIEANTAPGGSYPTTGWVALATVTGNSHSTRIHYLNLSGYNWVRIVCTKSLGSSGNFGVSIQVDIHAGPAEEWLFLGDSITFEGMQRRRLDGSVWDNGNLEQQVHALVPSRQPIMVDGGTSAMDLAWCATYINQLLAPFPGFYVAVEYGSQFNVASVLTTPQLQAYYANLLTIIDAITASGKQAIIPKNIYGTAQGGDLGVNANNWNAYLDAHLATDRPKVRRGADLYTPFYNNPALLRDGVHPVVLPPPTPTGYTVWQGTWRDWYNANYATLPQPVVSQFKPALASVMNGARTKITSAFTRNPMNVQQNSTVDSIATFSHADGSPIVVSSVSVLITFPDNTTVTHSDTDGYVVNNGGGKYTLTYTTKGVGTHIEDWTVTDNYNSVAKYRVYTSATL